MKRFVFYIAATALTIAIVAFTLPPSEHADAKAVDTDELRIPGGYREWRFISVAHEAGSLNDIRAILGNDVAIMAYREEKLPFPDGTIIARWPGTMSR